MCFEKYFKKPALFFALVLMSSACGNISLIRPIGGTDTASGTTNSGGGGGGGASLLRTNNGVVTTFAGSAPPPASPYAIAFDSAGNGYMTSKDQHVVMKISVTGKITVLAGTLGASGSADGLGSAARFDSPSGIAVDSSDNIYVSDNWNCTIRKITPAGTVTTFAGTAGACSLVDGNGTSARFVNPEMLAFDSSGDLYVADGAIRKITPAGVVTTFVGGGQGSADGTGAAAKFYAPSGLVFDTSGNLYITDTYNHTIRMATPGGVVTTLAGSAGASGSSDGMGAAAQFNFPVGIGIDSAGNLYVADTNNQTIRKVTPAGNVTTLAGAAGAFGNKNGTGGSARFFNPTGLLVGASDTLYVADRTNASIRSVTTGGVVDTFAGLGDADGTGTSAKFSYTSGVAVDSVGNVFVSDSNNQLIRKITPAGVVSKFAGTSGVSGTSDGTGASARFRDPMGIAIDQNDNLYVADYSNHAIRKITPAGVVTTLAGTIGVFGSSDGTGTAASFKGPNAVAVDTSGNVYVADFLNHTIRKITPAGVVTTLAGLAGASGSTDGTGSNARFFNPGGIAVESSGTIYVCDSGNNTIRKITALGVVTTLAGTAGVSGSADAIGTSATFNYPVAITVNSAGILYVADAGNNLVRRIGLDASVTTFAGTAGVSGSDDGTGTAATFYDNEAIAVDPYGVLYVADSSNYTIRKIE